MLQEQFELILGQQGDLRVSYQIGKVSTDVEQNSRVDILDFEIDLHCQYILVIFDAEVKELL